jgi:hypothetical protein
MSQMLGQPSLLLNSNVSESLLDSTPSGRRMQMMFRGLRIKASGKAFFGAFFSEGIRGGSIPPQPLQTKASGVRDA